MFSRFSLRGIQGISRPLLVKYQSSAPTTTSSNDPKTPSGDSSKRDLVNFPRRTRAEYAPPTRFGIIPESWFHYFYPKTGVTGPYMLMFGLGTYSLSKEVVVYSFELVHAISLSVFYYFVYTKYGDQIGEAYNKLLAKEEETLNAPQEREKKILRSKIDVLKNYLNSKDAVAEVGKAKIEMVYLQMEAAYRKRLAEAHKAVKDRLDCAIELQNVERNIFQKNLIDYVLRNVMSAITAEQEANAMKSCINDLNELAARA